MAINNKMEHEAIMQRIEELLTLVSNKTKVDDKNLIELTILSNLVADYEEIHSPVSAPTLIDVIKLRMFEMNLTQTSLAKLIGVSKSRISDYLNGRSMPTLQVAKELSIKLNIDPSIVLGV